jgi:hypothetical protein
MIVCASSITPLAYRVTGMDALVPLALTYGSHLIWPFVLDTDITTFTARCSRLRTELNTDRHLVLDGVPYHKTPFLMTDDCAGRDTTWSRGSRAAPSLFPLLQVLFTHLLLVISLP